MRDTYSSRLVSLSPDLDLHRDGEGGSQRLINVGQSYFNRKGRRLAPWDGQPYAFAGVLHQDCVHKALGAEAPVPKTSVNSPSTCRNNSGGQQLVRLGSTGGSSQAATILMLRDSFCKGYWTCHQHSQVLVS
jgi:hypothetical protein